MRFDPSHSKASTDALIIRKFALSRRIYYPRRKGSAQVTLCSWYIHESCSSECCYIIIAITQSTSSLCPNSNFATRTRELLRGFCTPLLFHNFTHEMNNIHHQSMLVMHRLDL